MRRWYGVVRPFSEMKVTISDEAAIDTDAEDAEAMAKLYRNLKLIVHE